jgi:hypothetical protein
MVNAVEQTIFKYCTVFRQLDKNVRKIIKTPFLTVTKMNDIVDFLTRLWYSRNANMRLKGAARRLSAAHFSYKERRVYG